MTSTSGHCETLTYSPTGGYAVTWTPVADASQCNPNFDPKSNMLFWASGNDQFQSGRCMYSGGGTSGKIACASEEMCGHTMYNADKAAGGPTITHTQGGVGGQGPCN